MEFFLTAILGGIILFCIYWLATININYWEKHGFPHVKSLPLFGNSLDVVLKRKSMNELLEDIYYKLEGEKCGGFLQFLTPVLLIRDPELINKILIKDFSYFSNQGFTIDKNIDPLSAHLFNLKGSLWKNTRNKLLPTFTSSKLKGSMFDQIKDCSEEAALYFKKRTDNEFEVRDVMFKLSLNIKGAIAYGINADAFNEKEGITEFISACKKFFAPSLIQSIKLMLSMSAPKLQTILKYKMIDKEVDSFFTSLVKDSMKYREETGIRRNDFLQLMIDLKKQEDENINNFDKKSEHIDKNDLDESDQYLLGFQNSLEKETSDVTPMRVITEECIGAHTFVFISGGSDASASVLTFALYELAVNKNIQIRLQNEIDSQLSKNFNFETLKKIKYLDNFLNEVLRIYGAGGGSISRQCVMNYQIPDTNMIIEKGTLIIIPAKSLQNDPKYYQNPEKFDPDRFEQPITKGTFLPFGDGPRMCIAMRQAMLEIKIVLATLLTHFNIMLSNRTKQPLEFEKTSFFAGVKGGVWVKFENRKHNNYNT